MNLESFANVFPLGSHLCREPMPPMAWMVLRLGLLSRLPLHLEHPSDELGKARKGDCANRIGRIHRGGAGIKKV